MLLYRIRLVILAIKKSREIETKYHIIELKKQISMLNYSCKTGQSREATC